MPGCWKDWNGLEEVTEVTAFWGEGIGRNSHTLELQELGKYGRNVMLHFHVRFNARVCVYIYIYTSRMNRSVPFRSFPKLIHFIKQCSFPFQETIHYPKSGLFNYVAGLPREIKKMKDKESTR